MLIPLSLSLFTTAPPMPSTCAMVRKTTNVGTTVVLKHCDLTTPVPLSELSFQWKKNNNDIITGGRFSINQRGWLTIENIQESDFGTYRVNISNDEGSAVHTVNLERVEPVTTPAVGRLRSDGEFDMFKFVCDRKRESRGESVCVQENGIHDLLWCIYFLCHSDAVAFNLKFRIQSGSTTCNDIKVSCYTR